MSLELDIVELYNPLYFLPIISVVFCALLVYAFGFKSPTLPPNFDQFEEKKIVANIKKKKPNKELNKISSGKAQQNGTIGSHNNIEEKKSSPEKIEAKTVIEKKPKPVKKNRKNARLNEDDSFDTQELEEKDSL